MYRDFPPAIIQDVHKGEVDVTVTTDGDGRHSVRLHSEHYSPGVSMWLEPDAARAIATALLEAADEATTRQLEDDELDARAEELRQEAADREHAKAAEAQLVAFLAAAEDRGATVTWITGATRNFPGQDEDERLGQ